LLRIWAPINLDPRTSHFWINLHQSQVFFDAISSVGFAGLSIVTNNRILMVAAKHKHATTLSHVADALKNLNHADLDETEKEVMLLAVFELSLSL
jgi:hypothetical protein